MKFEEIKKEIENIVNGIEDNYSNIRLFEVPFPASKTGQGSIEEIHYATGDKAGESYYIIHLAGGLNGRGQFLFYMEDASKLVKKLMTRFNRVWLIEWKNDCLDDIFYLDIGVRF